MKHILILLCYLLWALPAAAHNPLSARYHLEVNGNSSTLHIYLSQEGLQAALKKTFPEADLSDISTKSYKQFVLQYLKKRLNLQANQQPLELGKGGIKIGSHQSNLKFSLKNTPSQLKTLTVNIPAFKENRSHQTIFTVRYQGQLKQIILNQDNKFKEQLVFN